MRPVVGSLLLAALSSTACLPPRTVSEMGTAPDIGLLVVPAKGEQRFEVTLARPAYLVVVEVALNQGARLVAASTGNDPVAPGHHALTLQARRLTAATNGVTASPATAYRVL